MEFDQYTTSKVKPKAFVSGWVIAILIAGTGLTLPMFYIGSEIALSVGFKDALIAFVISTLILTIFSAITTRIGNRSRLSTYMILHFSFGRKGAKIINLIFGFALLGWYSFAIELLATAIGDTALEVLQIPIPNAMTILVVSLLITATTIYGIQRIEKLNGLTVPIISLFFCYLLYNSLISKDLSEIWNYSPVIQKMSLFEAITILVESSILFPVLMADFSRFVKNDKHSLIAVLGIAIGYPVALLFCSIPSVQTGQVDIMQIMIGMDIVLPAFGLLFISTWAANSSNLYSVVLTFATIKGSWNFRKLTIVFGLLGTVLALLEFSNYLFDFLNLLGVLTPSISSIYIVDFFWVRKQKYQLSEIEDWGFRALISWLVSSIVAALTYFEVIQLSGMFFLDAFLIGGLIYVFLKWRSIISNLEFQTNKVKKWQKF